MELRKNTDTATCKNGYTDKETFMESFGQDSHELENCNGCPDFIFSCGIGSCKKFDKE